MKTNSSPATISFEPAEDDIRDYAYHLYIQGGSVAGRDLDNWLEAKACLRASVAKSESHTRLHRQTQKQPPAKPARPAARGIAA